MMLRKRIARLSLTTIVGLVVLPATIGAQDTLRVISGEVTVVCPLTIGGSFEATTKVVAGEVGISPPNAQSVKGDFSVDLRTLDTGIPLRNRHLRQNYLEVERGPAFAAARLQDIRVERLSGKTTFRGTLTLHGERKEVSGTAEIAPNGPGYLLEASFPVRISEFRIPDPTYLGVGVKDEVVVRVKLHAAPATAVAQK